MSSRLNLLLSGNVTGTNSLDRRSYALIPFFLLLSITPTFVAIFVFYRCRKLSFNVRFWIIHIQIVTAVRLVWGIATMSSDVFEWNELAVRIYDGVDRGLLHASFVITTAMGIDRLASLLYPTSYQIGVSPYRLKCCLALLYIISLSTGLSVFVGDIKNVKLFGTAKTTTAAEFTTIVVLFIFCSSTMVVFSVVGYIACKKKREVMKTSVVGQNKDNDYSKFLQLTLKSFILVVLNLTGVVPLILVSFIYIYVGHERGNKEFVVAQQIVVLLFAASRIVQPFVYIASFKESRIRILLLLSCGMKARERRLMSEYKQYYASYEIASVTRP